MPRYIALEQPVPKKIISTFYTPEGILPQGAPIIVGITPSENPEEQRDFLTNLYAMSVPINARLHISVDDDRTFKGWLVPVKTGKPI